MSNKNPDVIYTYLNRKGVFSATEHKLSDYFPPAMEKALQKANIPQSHYIMGPLYKEGDIQIGLTGGVGRGEQYINAVIREMGEEVGIVPNDEDSVLNDILTSREKHRTTKVYSINITDTVTVMKHQHNAKIPKNPDDRSKKIGCFVHGTLKNIINHLESTIYLYDSPDSIVGVGAVKARIL